MDNSNPDSTPPAPLAARAVRYVEIVTEITRKAKLPGYTVATWNTLAPLVATDEFLLVGHNKQELDWPATIACMDGWARAAEFSSALRRVEEAGALVFMELDEQVTVQGQTTRRHTMTMYEFDTAGKLRRLDAFG
jgi:hypothetical protein